MAVSAANIVSPTPATGNPVANAAGITPAAVPTGGGFIDSLEAVLGISGVATGGPTGNADQAFAALVQNKTASLKSKLKLAAAESGAAVLNPQLAQQQTIIAKLQDTASGIDIPALRAAMAKNAAAPAQTSSAPAAPPEFPAQANAQDAASVNPVQQAALQSTIPVPGDAAAPPTNSLASQTNAAAGKAAVDTSKSAQATTATQQKLLAALAKTADAPVLKEGTVDGSKVPNAKIGKQPAPQKQDMTPDQVVKMATNIAATAGVTNAPDAAPAAAQGVAVAEVAIKTATSTPSVTKVETAAMNNAAQTATHTPAQKASVEAQAMPVQFDAQSANPDGKNSGTSSDGKDQGQAGNTAHNSGKAATMVSQPSVQTFAASQPSSSAPATQVPTQSAPAQHTVSPDASAGVAASTTTAPPATQIAVNLHVAPQGQHSATPDQTAFAALGVTIAAKSQNGERHFDIRLDPAELGKVDVRISVDSDGKAQAHLAAEHPQTLQLLQNDKPNLERQLRDAGLNLSNNGLNFSLRGEQQSSTPTFNARSRALSVAAVQTPDTSTNSLASIAPGDSRLDIRV